LGGVGGCIVFSPSLKLTLVYEKWRKAKKAKGKERWGGVKKNADSMKDDNR